MKHVEFIPKKDDNNLPNYVISVLKMNFLNVFSNDSFKRNTAKEFITIN